MSFVETQHTRMPESELDFFKSLRNIKIVFDVGARDDDEYTRLKPGIDLHAFEPNPQFFRQLQQKIGTRPHTYLNNYGLGDVEGEFGYDPLLQALEGGMAQVARNLMQKFQVKTLDWYIEKNNIKRIDFLKIDTEGYDYKVLLGATKALTITRYVQYEHWDPGTKMGFHDLLEKDFYMTYIGHRNVLCERKPV